MLLALSIVSEQGAALGPTAYKVFDERGGSIGRVPSSGASSASTDDNEPGGDIQGTEQLDQELDNIAAKEKEGENQKKEKTSECNPDQLPSSGG